MIRLRLASWAALAGLGLLTGCQSSGTSCNGNGNGGLFRGGLMSRFGNRSRCCDPVCAGTTVGAPVEGLPVSNGFLLGDMPTGGSCPTCNGAGLPSHGNEVPFAPGATVVPDHGPSLPPGATNLPPSPPAGGMLPSPTPIGDQPALAPVPSGNNYARPIPAPPTSRNPTR